MDEIFYEFKEITSDSLSIKGTIEIVLHFLAKIEEIIVLYETKQIIVKSSDSNIDKQVINALKNIFQGVDASLSLVKGKIREIFLSYSS
ncbi:MAG: hypothetical protein ACFFB0_10880 [Promethearchaeota archaeon]